MAEVEELRAACAEAARLGGAVLRERWGQVRTIELKGGIDLVTDADRASEAAVLGFLSARFPGASVLAEESGASGAGAGGLRFFVDPLDGTTNYAHGVPHFAVNVAVADGRGLAAGATYDPLRDELYPAARGGGATLNGARLRHSARAELRGALLVTGFPYDIHERLRRAAAAVRRVHPPGAGGPPLRERRARPRLRRGGALRRVLGAAAQALGRRRRASSSRGRRAALVTDFEGGDRMLESGDIVAAAPALLAPMLAVIAAERAAVGAAPVGGAGATASGGAAGAGGSFDRGRDACGGPARRGGAVPARKSMPRSDSGSTSSPAARALQCRCGPVERPVEPITPSRSPRAHLRARADVDPVQVEVEGEQVRAVPDHHGLPGVEAVAGEHDLAVVRGADRRAARPVDVEAVVDATPSCR